MIKPVLKIVITVCLIAATTFASAQTKSIDSDYRRFHFTVEAGFNKTNIDEVLTNTFVKELYQGSKNLLDDYLSIGGSPENTSGSNPVINLSLDISASRRLKFGIGFNGIPETHIIGYINKDSLVSNPDYANQVYDKVEEIVKGNTLKIQTIFALKPYSGRTALGWELDFGAGLTFNLVNVKQSYLLQSVDSITGQIINDYYQTSDKRSSVGAFLSGRLDVHLTKGFSITGDFNWMFDTGIKINETNFDFYDTTRQIDAHKLKFNSYLVAVGASWHF